MRCQSCDKNDATTTVICEACEAYYASIREGQFDERAITMGDFQLRVMSWSAAGATAAKKATREDKGTNKKRALFGRKKAEPEVVEETPPPDWKNRVFPDPNAPAPAEEPAYGLGLTSLTYDVDQHAAEQTVPHAEEAPTIFDSPPPGMEPEPEPEPMGFFDTAPAAQPEAAPEEDDAPMQRDEAAPAPVEPEPAAEAAPPSPELVNFFDSLMAPEPPAPAPVEEAPAPPSPELAGFFESLAAPAEAPEPEAPAAEPEPEAPAGLASFFESLSAPEAPAVEPAHEEAPAPAAPSAELADFFSSLAAPADEVAAAPEAPPETTAASGLDTFFEALGAPPAPAAEEPQQAPANNPDLADFFSTLAAPAPEAPSAASQEAPAPSESSAELAGFFQSLSAQQEDEAPAEPEAGGSSLADQIMSAEAAAFFAEPEPAAPPTTEQRPFAIEIDLPGAPVAPPEPPRMPSADSLRPPTVGQPFSIDLTSLSPPPPPPPRRSAADELKRAHSTGELSFVGGDEEEAEPTGFGLLDGLAFDKKPDQPQPSSNSGAGYRSVHDDDDDEKIVDL